MSILERGEEKNYPKQLEICLYFPAGCDKIDSRNRPIMGKKGICHAKGEKYTRGTPSADKRRIFGQRAGGLA